MKYDDFLANKAQLGDPSGFDPIWIPDEAFDFQKYLIDWAVKQGRAALYTDTGTGKSLMQLVWAENVARKTGKNILIATPLAVCNQTVNEAARFGVEASVSRDGKIASKITVTNYERLHYFNPVDFVGMVCDESAILKSFNGATRQRITEFMRLLPYRLLCTATPSPNDYTELGTSSEALGGLGYMDMLGRFFKNEQNSAGTGRLYGQGRSWRFKGHSSMPFWRWVASWARAMRKPSDYGFDDSRFELPPLIEREHIVKSRTLAPGFLFEMPANGMREERDEQRRTIQERCEKAAELAAHDKPCAIFCNLNDESDLLQKLLSRDFVNIKAKTDEKSMREREDQFAAFSSGELRGVIIKPKVGAMGLNWQHCAHVISFPTYSFEQYYQLVRRFHRYGQKSQVVSDLIATESSEHIKDALQRKARQADEMFSALVRFMHEATVIQNVNFSQEEKVPVWL